MKKTPNTGQDRELEIKKSGRHFTYSRGGAWPLVFDTSKCCIKCLVAKDLETKE